MIDVIGVPNNSAVTAAAFVISTAGVVTVGQSPLNVPTRIQWASGVTAQIGTQSTQPLILRTDGTDRWAIHGQSGTLVPVASTLDIGTSAGPNPRYLFIGDEIVLSDAGANATAGGRLRRSGANLTWHDGTAAVSLNTGGGLRFVLRPESATFPTSNFPQLTKNSSGVNWIDYTLDYDTTTEESAYWYGAIPTGLVVSTTPFVEVYSRQPTAITGTVAWNVVMAGRGSGILWDSGGVTNLVSAVTVQGTAGQLLRQGAALSSTGLAAAQAVQIRISRDVAADNVAEDVKFIEAVVRLV